MRVQAERMHGAFFPSAREYAVRFGLSQQRADRLPDHAVVLHPGPAVRGMEIASSVADSGRAAIAERSRRRTVAIASSRSCSAVASPTVATTASSCSAASRCRARSSRDSPLRNSAASLR